MESSAFSLFPFFLLLSCLFLFLSRLFARRPSSELWWVATSLALLPPLTALFRVVIRSLVIGDFLRLFEYWYYFLTPSLELYLGTIVVAVIWWLLKRQSGSARSQHLWMMVAFPVSGLLFTIGLVSLGLTRAAFVVAPCQLISIALLRAKAQRQREEGFVNELVDVKNPPTRGMPAVPPSPPAEPAVAVSTAGQAIEGSGRVSSGKATVPTSPQAGSGSDVSDTVRHEESTRVPVGQTANPFLHEEWAPPVGPTASPVRLEKFAPPVGPTASPVRLGKFAPPVGPTASPVRLGKFAPPVGPTASPVLHEEPARVPGGLTASPLSRRQRIFLSYRREDSADVAGRIYDRLTQKFGKEQVFKDVDSIPLGLDFRKHLAQMVGSCDVFLAVIGVDWHAPAAAGGKPRLDDPKDFVRIELEAALQRDIPVIPVLVRGAQVPDEGELPTTLATLAYRNGMSVRADPDFHRDMDRLIEGIETYLAGG